jgi:hypothetical protein
MNKGIWKLKRMETARVPAMKSPNARGSHQKVALAVPQLYCMQNCPKFRIPVLATDSENQPLSNTVSRPADTAIRSLDQLLLYVACPCRTYVAKPGKISNGGGKLDRQKESRWYLVFASESRQNYVKIGISVLNIQYCELMGLLLLLQVHRLHSEHCADALSDCC